MRILFLTAETFPTFRVDVSVLFGKYLPRHGIFSDLTTGQTPGSPNTSAWGGGETHLCNVSGGQAGKHAKMFVHGIRQLFGTKRSRYCAIQVRDMPVLGVFGLIAARLKGVQFYYWMSYPMSEGQIELAKERGFSAGYMKFLFPWLRGRVGYALLYRFVLPRADHVFVQSERMQADLAARGLDRSKMTPVPMGVDLEEVRSDAIVPADDPRLKGRRAIVYLGSLDRPRRIEILFETLVLVRRQVPGALLVLVGNTEDAIHREFLAQQARDRGIADDVIWTGWLPMHSAWSYVSAAEIGLSPIPRGFLLDCSSPTKLAEYLALGVPVVCNDNPDQECVIRESGAGLCVPYTPSDFAAAILELFAIAQERGNRGVGAGRAYVEAKRSYERISRELAGKYKVLLKNSVISK